MSFYSDVGGTLHRDDSLSLNERDVTTNPPRYLSNNTTPTVYINKIQIKGQSVLRSL